MVNNRLLYTRQGSHLNVLGKELLSNQLVSHIFLLLERVKGKPIILELYDKETQTAVPLKSKPSLTQMSTRQSLNAIENYQQLETMIFYGTPKCESS
jgi:hypothetical protein